MTDKQRYPSPWGEFLALIPPGITEGAGEFLYDLIGELVDHQLVTTEQLLDLAQQLAETGSGRVTDT